MVLDGIVRAAHQDFRELGPFVRQVAIIKEQNQLFFQCPRTFLDLWVKVIVPSLTA